MNFNKDNDEVIQDTNPKASTGKFFQKKILGGVFLVISLIVIFILFRHEIFFSSGKDTSVKQVVKKEEKENAPPPLDASYGDVPTDLVTSYSEETVMGYTKEDLETEAQEQMSKEEQDRLNRLKELEQEANAAFRSPTTITIATRPQVQSLDNKVLLSSNKQVADYDGNRQESKKNFLMNEAAQKFYQLNFLTDALSEFELKAGDFIPAVMITGINSDLPSKIITAMVSENVRDTVKGNHILIPQGTKVIGTYDSSITFGQERLLVIWQRLILPNGKSLALDNMQGVDLSGQAGITGVANNHFATLLKGVILSSLMGSAGAIVTDRKSDWRGAAAEGAGEQIVSIGDRFAEKALSRQPTIIVKPGVRFNIMVHSDLVLEPYEG